VKKANDEWRTRKKDSAGQTETIVFANEVRKRVEDSGLSANKFWEQTGISNMGVHYSYLLNAKRGLSLWKSMQIANAIGIDLGEVQRKAKRLSNKKAKQK
jgi:proteasome assembly chaperone (PAC2) family protein